MNEAQFVNRFFVVLNEDVCLDSYCEEFFVRGKVVQVGDAHMVCSSFVFLPNQESLAEKGIMCAHAIVKTSDEFVPIRVIKPEGSPVHMKKGTKMGDLEELNSINGYVEDVRMIENKEYRGDQEKARNVLYDVSIGVHAPEERIEEYYEDDNDEEENEEDEEVDEDEYDEED